ncbi:hypothetical protein CRYUN_Cryun20dG0067700 [Craigia yunnanensis]
MISTLNDFSLLLCLNGLVGRRDFPINPENSQEEHVRDQLNRGIVPDNIDVHCLAGLIKAWFPELPLGVLDGLSPEQMLRKRGIKQNECKKYCYGFCSSMTQMSDPLTALMHVVQVMNLLKTLIMKTLRERGETATGGYFPMSSHSCDGPTVKSLIVSKRWI